MRVAVAVLAVAVLGLGASPAWATGDRTPPTKPGNVRVVAKTNASVTIAWNASTDNSGSLNYVVHLWQDPRTVTLPKTQTSYTWTGLLPNGQYYLWVDAVDPSGNKSTSELVVVVLDRDTTPPSTPANVRVSKVTASQVSLAWDPSSDDAAIRSYLISMTPQRGNFIWTGPTSVDILGLPPSTAFSFSVRAQDYGYNTSPTSTTVTATTLASTDTTPPTVPANFRVSNSDGCGEVSMSWTQSTDDQDPQAAISYKVFINGAPDPIGFTPIGVGRSFTYAIVDGSNTFVLRAVDSAGNVSAPSTAVTLNVHLCR